MEWRHTRTQQQATEEEIAKEIEQGSFAEGYAQLVQDYTGRMFTVLADIGLSDAQRTLYNSVAALGLLTAKIVAAEPRWVSMEDRT